MTFHKASTQLAGLYLVILMAISLFFSIAVYHTSSNELSRGLQRPSSIFTQNQNPDFRFPAGFRQQFNAERAQQVDDVRTHVLHQLIIINLLILVAGGVLCYYLALRTLKPIEEAHEAQSRFTADASHELRTPITVMRTENEVALMNPKLSLDQARQQLRSNIEELEKLTSLTEGLLRLAQLDNHQLETEAVSTKTLVNNAVARVLPQAEKRHITISSTVETDAMILADESSLTEALVTLLDNAVKYSLKKSEVLITASEEQHQIIFRVKDTGIGIKASELPHVFDRFYRADSSRTKQKVEGYGLGLAIAKGIANAHGGSLNATSTVGQGSVFTLVLPAVYYRDSKEI